VSLHSGGDDPGVRILTTHTREDVTDAKESFQEIRGARTANEALRIFRRGEGAPNPRNQLAVLFFTHSTHDGDTVA
jgi:hypothetical protein